tara:strand:- start:354 stop:467 length:114 start_codon:yes stop_codon:yes gene_type:complete
MGKHLKRRRNPFGLCLCKFSEKFRRNDGTPRAKSLGK